MPISSANIPSNFIPQKTSRLISSGIFTRVVMRLYFTFFVCSKCGTLLRRWPPTAPESAQRTGRSSHSRTVHPKIGEHHREQSRQPFSGCAGPAIAGTPAQGQRAGRSAAPDSKSMSGSVPLRRLLTFVDKGIVKPKCPRNVTAAKKFH